MESSTKEPPAGLVPYQYQPLEEEEIRVLMLEPGAFGDPLRGYFLVLHLGDDLLRPMEHHMSNSKARSIDHSADEENEHYSDGEAIETLRESRSSPLWPSEHPPVPHEWYYTKPDPERSAPSPKRPRWLISASNSESGSEMNSFEGGAQNYCAISYAWGFFEATALYLFGRHVIRLYHRFTFPSFTTLSLDQFGKTFVG
jgi:hypothetical protein